ncbi:MAG: CDP-alcohol phosphatidyltransferase family protein [Deltaproteobacteria bacterium]|nr:CDP-alcohol phosphatidyltransferase family protein [Deltaproteobacteria bacterium]
MSRYDVRDLLRVPGLLSLARIPLAAAFTFVVGRPLVAFGVLVVAGLTDVLDGWYARRFDQVTATGSVLDPITDKLFVTTVAITLVVTGHLSIAAVVLLSTREIGELPLVVWFAASPAARRARVEQPSANVVGKIATALQFVSVSVALFRAPHPSYWVGATAVAGVLAAITYWRRALVVPPARRAA